MAYQVYHTMSQAEITSYDVVKGGHIPADASNIVVGTDEEGDIIPPESIAAYEKIEGVPYGRHGWAVPIGIEEEQQGNIPLKRPIYAKVYVDGYSDIEVKIAVSTNVRQRNEIDAGVIDKTSSEKAAVNKAIDWILGHGTEAQASVPQRHLATESSLDDLNSRFNRIRQGTRLTIPNYEGQFEALHELDVCCWDRAYLLEHSSGTLFRLLDDTGSLDYSTVFLQPIHGFGIEISDFTTFNEHNLRDDVATETYNLIKENVGSKMAHFHTNDDYIFEIVEIDSVNDGFVNPREDAPLDPDKHNPSGIYIDDSEAAQWVPLTEMVQGQLDDDATYILTDDGVYQKSDHYALDQKVPASLWYDQDETPEPEETYTLTEFDLTNPLETGTDSPDPDDPLTVFPYIGDKRAESIHAKSVGQAIERGFPFYEVPKNGKQKILDMIHGMDLQQRFGTTAKLATMGLLGAIGHDINGEKVGSLASLLVEDVSIHEIEWAWLAPGHSLRKEYGTDFGSTPEHKGFALGVGTPERGNVIDYLHSEGTQIETPVTTLRTPIRMNELDSIALGSPQLSKWVEMPRDLLEYISHLLQVDFTDTDNLEEHAVIRTLKREKRSFRLIEFQHPTTNTVAIVAPDRFRDVINIHEWNPW